MLTKEQLTEIGVTDETILQKILDANKADEQRVIQNRDKTIYGFIESEVEKITGLKPNLNDNEKATEFMARAYGEFATAKGSEIQAALDSTKEEMETLKGQLKAGKGNETLKAEFEALQTKYKGLEKLRGEEKAQFESTLKSKDDEFKNLRFDQQFSTGLPSFSKDANEYEVRARIAEAKEMVKNQYKHHRFREDGTLEVSENEYDFSPVSEVLKNHKGFESILPQERQAAGGGSGKAGGHSQVGSNGKFILPPEVSEDDWYAKDTLIQAHLTSKGLNPASPEWDESYSALMNGGEKS